MVLRQGSTMLVIGMTLGLGAGLLLSRQLTQLLFQVAPDDPTVVIATLAVLGLTGLAACLVPARRASSLSPLTALRRD
jgi:ABC-type antimicrobial peptide transport system permease subunit